MWAVDRVGAAMFTAEVEAGSTVVVFGAGMVGLGAVAGAGCGARSGSSASTSPRSAWRSHAATEPPTSWVGGEETVARVLEESDGMGADYTFEATGLVR